MEVHGEPIPLLLPRHAVSPRQVARAGEIWRLFQVAAVEAASRRGWPPGRMLAERAAFIVAHMTVVHHREASYGEELHARTWLRDFRRGTLTRREIRLLGEAGPVARTTQQWVYVDEQLKPTRAPPEMVADFAVDETAEPPVALPDFLRLPSPSEPRRFTFEVWHTWMDPIAHVNHPVYVDWCDEAVARVVSEAGGDPQAVVPEAEYVRFRRGALAGERVVLETRLIGRTEAGAAVLRHAIGDGGEGLFAEAITVRRFAKGAGLAALWEA